MTVLESLSARRGLIYYPICWLIGLFGILGHSPYHFWPVTILMFAVLFGLLRVATTLRRAFWTGLWVGTGYFMGQVYWMSEAFAARGEGFVYLMPFMVGGLAVLMSSPWAVMSWVFHRFKHGVRWPYMVLALVFFVAEYIRGHLFGGFPWDLPGYIFKASGAASQSVSLIGIYGLSLLVLIIAGLMARALWKRHYIGAGLGAALLLANWGFGYLRLNAAELQYVDNVKIRIVSAPFSQKRKIMDRDYGVSVIQDHINLSASPGLDKVTHLVWPEGVIDWDIRRMDDLRLAMGQTFQTNGGEAPVWIINNTRLDPKDGHTDYYNSTTVLSYADRLDGDIVAFADKQRLVPFGEIIPGGKFIERLGARVISEDIGSFTPAPKKEILQIPGLPPGSAQICYEVIFSGLTPRSKEQKVNWILNQSNDAWFGSSAGPVQHANIARYRAIEEKVPVIRAASNGASGIIDPYGRFLETALSNKSGVMDMQLPHSIGESLPFKWINLLLFLLCLAGILISRPNK